MVIQTKETKKPRNKNRTKEGGGGWTTEKMYISKLHSLNQL